MIYKGPTDTTHQVSWYHHREGNFWLSVVAKRSYTLDGLGRLVPAPKQEPLRAISGDMARDGCVEHEADIYPFKPLTDVVVQGHAYPASAGQTSFVARIDVGRTSKSLRIVGDRKATLSRTGAIVLASPAPIEKVPLSYDRAYGGIDRVAEEKYGNPMMALEKARRPEFQPEYHSPFIYPRNAAGRGYLVEKTAQAVEALQLPNIEDPDDPLEKRDLEVGDVRDWPRMPLPWGTNWLHPAYFPRVAYLGAARQFKAFPGPWPEVRRGFAPEGWPRLGDIDEVMDYRFYNAGSLGLQLPAIGEEPGLHEFRLAGFMRGGRALAFRLPAVAPRIWVDGRNGTLKATRPALHHVVIRPDDGQVHVLWRGCAPALRQYMPDELDRMPYRIEWDPE